MSKLEFSGAEPQTDRGKPGLTLDQVYTALLTTELVRPEEPAHPGGRRRPSPKPPAPGEERNRSAVEQLNRHARLVLLGDPGSGKSSFVNYITLCLAGELLSDRPANLALLTAPLPQSEEQDAEPPGPQPWDHGPLLPVCIVLRNFAATGLPPVGKPATAKHLWRFICGELATATLGEFAKPLKKHLRDRGGLILLDGLDEVPEADARRTQIKQAVDSFARAFGKCRFLVTSRTYAYKNEAWALEDFASTELACFNAAQIAAFVDRWYARIAPLRDLSAADAQGRAALLKQAIFTNDRLAALAEQPLLLTLMANLHAYRGGSLPEKREQLYAAAVDLLLDWWERQRVVYGKEGQPQVIQPSLVEYLKLGKDRILAVLAELAFEAHASNPDPSQRAYIRQADLIDRLLAVSPDKDLRYERLVEYLSQRAGLLLPQGNRVFTLPHRTFQEYLAACHLTGPTYPDEVAELARQDPNRWREVLLLAGARAAAGTESPLWELAEALCFREPSSAGYGEEDDWGAHLAGQVLLESAGLTQVRPRNQPKLERIRHALVHVLEESRLPALERAHAGRTLAHLGDPRREVREIEEMRFCHVPAGPFYLGEGDRMQEVEIPYDYWIGRYPITNAHYAHFVAAGGYAVPEFWREAIEAGYWQDGRFYSRTGPYSFGSPFDLPNHPVVGVSWYEAVAFTHWLTEHLRAAHSLPPDLEVRLPTASEWEKAARGGLYLSVGAALVAARTLASAHQLSQANPPACHPNPRRLYPWGDEPDPDNANCEETEINTTSPVGAFARGTGPYGAAELSGNVWEWLLQEPGDLAGGAYWNDVGGVTSAARFRNFPVNRPYPLGFRCVVVPISREPF